MKELKYSTIMAKEYINQLKLNLLPAELKDVEEYKTRRMNDDEIIKIFEKLNQKNLNIGIICGSTSDNLEVMRFTEAGHKEAIFIQFFNKPEVLPIFMKCPFKYFKEIGNLLFYRYDKIEDSQILAKMNNVPIIQTIGEGDFAICAPNKKCTGGVGTLDKIPRLTIEERSILINAARSFDKRYKI